MSVLTSRPVMRWLVPAAAAVTVVGGGAAIGTLAANADPALPERSAAQLLVDLQTARLDGLSGTVVKQADLGLPEIANLAGGGPGGASLLSLASGTHTLRVWYAGPDQARVALMDTLGQTDVIRNGEDVWVWNSRDNEAVHHRVPDEAGHATPDPLASGLPVTPQEAAEAALQAIDPSTEVTTDGSARVAGRDAYELVLSPRDDASLVHQVRLAVDAEEHVPLRVQVFARGADEPAFRVAFTRVDFERPDAEQFTFNPPPGATVTEGFQGFADRKPPAPGAPAEPEAGKQGGAKPADPEPTVVGEGWGAVLVLRSGDDAERTTEDLAAADELGLLNALPQVTGDWGSGRLFAGTLFSVLLTDDGRLLVGAVAPERLYEVAGSEAGR